MKSRDSNAIPSTAPLTTPTVSHKGTSLLSQYSAQLSLARLIFRLFLIAWSVSLLLNVYPPISAMPGRITSAPCATCGRTIQVRLDGKMKTHGPQANRCPGSGEPPADSLSTLLLGTSTAPVSWPQTVPNAPFQQDSTQQVGASSLSSLNPGCFSGRILKRIPRASRPQLAQKLTSTLYAINTQNNVESWECLILFPRRCLVAPKRGGHRRNLASIVSQAIQDEVNPPHALPEKQKPRPTAPNNLATRVSAKQEEGDFKGAVRLASSAESLCIPDERSLNQLSRKHPPAHPDSTFPPALLLQDTLEVSLLEVKKAVMSFPVGSAGGPDGLLPQHLKDLVSPSLGEVGASFVQALASFVTLVISGKVPHPVIPFFFGARLLGFNKSDGGVRLIAVGCTLRRLVSKCLGNSVSEEMGSLLFPLQLGFGTRKGAEGAVHAARAYLAQLQPGNLMLKLDFQNAFNSIRRDVILREVQAKAPNVYPLAFSAYRFPSFLFYGSSTIMSAEGVQQGDPLGPLLFCLGIHDLILSLRSQFRVFYLDDGTLGGTLDEVCSDLAHIESQAPLLGQALNQAKSEVICLDDNTRSSILATFPTLHPTDPSHAVLLGSPIGGIEAIEDVIKAKIADLQRMGERLLYLRPTIP